MNTYIVSVDVVHTHSVYVEANSESEAIKGAKRLYSEGLYEDDGVPEGEGPEWGSAQADLQE